MSGTEVRRRVLHIMPGLLPMILWLAPHDDFVSDRMYWIRLIATILCGVGVYAAYNRIKRSDSDREAAAACFGYSGSVLLMLLMFPLHPEFAMTVLAVLAFGDGSATLGGKLLGGPRLPWNHSKSVAGMLCFIAAGSSMATLYYWNERVHFQGSGAVTLQTALQIGCITTLIAAVVESIRSSVNDNIRVGFSAAVMVLALHSWAG